MTSLSQAIALWRSGRPIPLDLFADLNSQGYDVPALERHYWNRRV